MKPMQLITSTAVAFALAVSAPAQFTKGHLAILQVGDGVRPFANTGNQVIIKDFSPADNSFEFEVALPTNGPDAFILGSSAFTGSLSLSADEHSLIVAGYNTPLPFTSSLDTSSSAAVPRAIASVNYAGVYSLNVKITNVFSGGTIRGGVSDGKGNFWAGGVANGIQYLGNNSTQAMVGTAGSGAIRDILMVSGAIAYSSSQFPGAGFSGVVMFTNRNPTTPSAAAERLVINTTSNAIPGSMGTANPKGFAINRNLNLAYIVDMRSTASGGGIYRFNGDGLYGSTNWVYAYTIPSTVGLIQDIAVDFSGANPRIYGIAGTGTANSLVTVEDTGAGSTFTTLATAPAATSFRGIALAPVTPSRLAIQYIGGDVHVSWTGDGFLQTTSPITGTWMDLDGVDNPYILTPLSTNEFFRIQQRLYP